MAPGMKKGLVLGFAILLIVVAYLSYEWWLDSRPHAVTLSWQAPDATPDSPPLRYNIYRSDDGGTSFTCLSRRVTATTFRDVEAKAGKAYRYTVTSIDERGRESARSASVDVKVPR